MKFKTNSGEVVLPENSRQLVGYDKDGTEVYEGDLLSDGRKTYRAIWLGGSELTIADEKFALVMVSENDLGELKLKRRQICGGD